MKRCEDWVLFHRKELPTGGMGDLKKIIKFAIGLHTSYNTSCCHIGMSYKTYLQSARLLNSSQVNTYFILILTGNDTNNYVEAQFRVLKDEILQRTRAYNCAHLVQFLCVNYQEHTAAKLLDVAHSRKPLISDKRITVSIVKKNCIINLAEQVARLAIKC